MGTHNDPHVDYCADKLRIKAILQWIERKVGLNDENNPISGSGHAHAVIHTQRPACRILLPRLSFLLLWRRTTRPACCSCRSQKVCILAAIVDDKW